MGVAIDGSVVQVSKLYVALSPYVTHNNQSPQISPNQFKYGSINCL